MGIQKTIRISEDLNKFLETHAEKNKRSFSKTVEYLLEVGREKTESNFDKAVKRLKERS